MSNRIYKHAPPARRKGEAAFGDFADYVEQQQQASWRAATAATAVGTAGTKPTVPASDSGYGTTTEEHSELDALDALDLNDNAPPAPLRDLLSGGSDGEADSAGLDAQLLELVQARIDEGHGETMFDLGQEDNGDTMKFTKDQWEHALDRVRTVASILDADCRILLTRNVGGEVEAGPLSEKDTSATGKIMIRRRSKGDGDVIETRIAVIGNVDAGKSTMLGVLVKGSLDDGRGKARVNLFRHKHEIESGRTSSVGMEIMGFDSFGKVVAAASSGRKLSWEEIGTRSAKVVSFSDLAGHERYLRTTVFGLLSSSPNYCLLMVAANNGLVGMSKEHLGIALAQNVPVMVVITKIDICPPQILQETIMQLTKILKSPGARKIPTFIKTRADVVNTASQFVSKRIVPVFQVSNVTGESLDLVREFLNILPHHGYYDAEGPFEFSVNDTFSVPHVGTVVSGVVNRGVIHAGDAVFIGPDALGQFTATHIRSIERKRIPVMMCSAGQSASFALKKVKRKEVRKGMVVLSKQDTGTPKVYREFTAEVLILSSHATTIKPKYQAMLHVGPISQTCAIIALDREYIRTGDRATVAFRFVQRPEYLTVGARILFREGRTKGLGIITGLGYDESKPLGNKSAASATATAATAADGTSEAATSPAPGGAGPVPSAA